MWIPGASNSPGGVTIDLANLNSINVNTDASTVSVGPAATWDAVFAKLDPLGFSVTGGRVGGVGVGGLTLGGGLSHFGPRYGWTCDTVTSFEIVLADGSIVKADKTTNADLFRGLRGGSNNFGVVTRIDLKIFEQGPVWAATIYSPLATIDDQIKIFARLVAPENYDENASFITGFGYSQPQNLSVITNDLVYTRAVENPEYYEAFLDQPSIYNTSSLTNMTALSQQQANYLPPGVFR
jgi:FAD/FMN-containing dehydrogenase